ncbi:hypothetical protein Lfu02_49440 [Longispora fulva]|nr:hypothetical protein Lfu02_49440 [Longispora fulva]
MTVYVTRPIAAEGLPPPAFTILVPQAPARLAQHGRAPTGSSHLAGGASFSPPALTATNPTVGMAGPARNRRRDDGAGARVWVGPVVSAGVSLDTDTRTDSPLLGHRRSTPISARRAVMLLTHCMWGPAAGGRRR